MAGRVDKLFGKNQNGGFLLVADHDRSTDLDHGCKLLTRWRPLWVGSHRASCLLEIPMQQDDMGTVVWPSGAGVHVCRHQF